MLTFIMDAASVAKSESSIDTLATSSKGSMGSEQVHQMQMVLVVLEHENGFGT